MKKKKLFYGWRIVGAGACLQIMQSAMLHQAFGAYVAVLTAERGWSKTALSGAAALQSAESALIGPILGWIIDRFGPQGMVRMGIFILGAGFMLLSQIESLVGFYGAFFVIAVGASMSGFFPLNVAVIQWFDKFRARALSGFSLGLSVGGILLPVVAYCIATFGWRPTAFGSGVIFIVIGYPLARVVRRRPEDHGLTVDGLIKVSAADSSDDEPAPRRDFSAREAIRTRAFWMVSLGHACAMMAVYVVSVHAITHMMDLGYTLAEASFAIMLMTVGQGAGVLIGGAIGDRFEKRYLAAFCNLMHAAGLLMLTYALNNAMIVGFALLHGVAWGLRGPLMQAIRADYFGRRAIGLILGLSSMVVVSGHIIGPMVAGVFADWTGNYRVGFTVVAGLVCLGSLFFVMAKSPHER